VGQGDSAFSESLSVPLCFGFVENAGEVFVGDLGSGFSRQGAQESLVFLQLHRDAAVFADRVRPDEKVVRVFLDQGHPLFQVFVNIGTEHHPRQIQVKILVILVEDSLEGLPVILDHNPAADAGVTPDDLGPVGRIGRVVNRVFQQGQKLVQIQGLLELTFVAGDWRDVVVNADRQADPSGKLEQPDERRVVRPGALPGGQVGEVVVARHEFPQPLPDSRVFPDALDRKVNGSQVGRVETADKRMQSGQFVQLSLVTGEPPLVVHERGGDLQVGVPGRLHPRTRVQVIFRSEKKIVLGPFLDKRHATNHHVGDVVFVGDIDQPGQPPVPLPVRELEIAAILHQAGGVAGEGSVPVVKLPVLEKIQQMKMAVPVRLRLHGLTGGQTDSSE